MNKIKENQINPLLSKKSIQNLNSSPKKVSLTNQDNKINDLQNIINFRQSLKLNVDSLNLRNFQSNPNIDLSNDKKSSIFQKIPTNSSIQNQINSLNFNTNSDNINTLNNKNFKHSPVKNIDNLRNKYLSSNPPKINKVILKKKNSNLSKKKSIVNSKISNSEGINGSSPKILHKLKKRESTIDHLLFQRGLLGISINSAKDPQSILIVNKKITKLNLKIQELLNENNKKMLQEYWGFASSEDNRKITERGTTSSRKEPNRNPNSDINTISNKNDYLFNIHESYNNNFNQINFQNNPDWNNPKYKYLSLLRDDFLINEDIINMNDEVREIYNKNKKTDKLSKFENLLKMNKLKKMINAKTIVEKKEDDSREHNVIFIRKKDLRNNVYQPCFNHKTTYETLNRKSFKPKGFKRVKSAGLTKNLNNIKNILRKQKSLIREKLNESINKTEFNKQKDNFLQIEKEKIVNTNESINLNYIKNNEYDRNTLNSFEDAEIELDHDKYLKSSIMNKMKTNNCIKIENAIKEDKSNLNKSSLEISPVRNINLSKIYLKGQKQENIFLNNQKSLKYRDKFVKESKENFEKRFDVRNDFRNNSLRDFSNEEFDIEIENEKYMSKNKVNKRIRSSIPNIDYRDSYCKDKILDKNKIKQHIFRNKLTDLRKIFGVAYKASQKLDVRFIKHL